MIRNVDSPSFRSNGQKVELRLWRVRLFIFGTKKYFLFYTINFNSI
jgi:hypothetical protein